MTGVGDQQVLGHAAVETQTAAAAGNRRQLRVVAVGLQVGQAASAGAAAPGADDGDRLAGLEAGHPGTQGVDPAGVLVAEGEGRAPWQLAGVEVVHEVQVGVAGAGAADLDQDLTGAGFRDGHVAQHGRAVPGLQA